MKVVIAGSRSIGTDDDGLQLTDTTVVEEAVKASGYDITEVVCGCAKGVDTLGSIWAEDNNIRHTGDRFKPKWNEGGHYNPRAGFERNALMVEYADAVIVIWDGKSGGSKDTIKKTESAGKPLYVFE